jgi:integral membrane sensor domain MASE1
MADTDLRLPPSKSEVGFGLTWPLLSLLAGLMLFYVAYVLAGRFSQGLAIIPGIAVSFWPPSGIFVATLLLNPKKTWPVWVIIGCAAELTANAFWFRNTMPVALTYYVGNAVEALTAAWLIDRFGSKPFWLDTMKDVVVFVVLGAGVAPLTACAVVSAVDLISGTPISLTSRFLLWLGDGAGMLVAGPITLAFVQAWRANVQRYICLGSLKAQRLLC